MASIIEDFNNLDKDYKNYGVFMIVQLPFWYAAIFMYKPYLILNYSLYISLSFAISLTIASSLIYYIVAITMYFGNSKVKEENKLFAATLIFVSIYVIDFVYWHFHKEECSLFKFCSYFFIYTIANIIGNYYLSYRNIKNKINIIKYRHTKAIEITNQLESIKSEYEQAKINKDTEKIKSLVDKLSTLHNQVIDLKKIGNSVFFKDIEDDLTKIEDDLGIKKG